MKKYFFCFLLAFFIGIVPLIAAHIQSVKTYSKCMNKEIPAVIITPEDYSVRENYPVLYLLHGYSDNQNKWIKTVPEIKEYADMYKFIIVCPDGNFSSWYMDSPIDSSFRYETYTSKELPHWIDSHYSTIASRKGRAITGLSMGGHGALYLAFRHQDIFGAAGSMSGGVDLRPFPKNWDISKRLGTYAKHSGNWEKNSVINLVHLLTSDSLQITFDCGSSDFFYQVNCNLHKKLLERNIPHDFTVRPGVHNWKYWKNSIAFQAVFFHHFFEHNKN